MGVTLAAVLGTTASLASAGAGIYSASQASKQAKAAQRAADEQRSALGEQLGLSEEALQALFENQKDPAEVFQEIFTSLPGLLDQVLPDLRRQSTETADAFTASNLHTRQTVIDALFPELGRFQQRQIQVLDSLDPANMGAEDIRAVTKQLAGIIPADTLDPNTGAVAGGVTSPVAIYRNAIDANYQDRKAQFLNAITGYIGNAENTAARQQERASTFFGGFLNLAANASGALTQQTIAQQQGNIATQAGFVNQLLGMQVPQPDLSSYNQAITAGINQAVKGVGSAINSFSPSTAKPAAAAPTAAAPAASSAAVSNYRLAV